MNSKKKLLSDENLKKIADFDEREASIYQSSYIIASALIQVLLYLIMIYRSYALHQNTLDLFFISIVNIAAPIFICYKREVYLFNKNKKYTKLFIIFLSILSLLPLIGFIFIEATR